MKTITNIIWSGAVMAMLASLALLPSANAVVPPPDGGYRNGNTAEGTYALFSLTTGFRNTANGIQALYSNTTGGGNTANGAYTLVFNTTGFSNTATGAATLQVNTTGSVNTATGAQALISNTTGFFNTATGVSALFFNTIGNSNTATGFAALLNNTGSDNIALGSSAGSNLTTGNNNIDIGNTGLAAESNTMRIGTAGTQTNTFIAGISGTPVVGDAVVVDGNGQLGTVASSRRFKDGIRPMDKTSEAILTLRPVTFHYKSDKAGTPRFGLISEEVAQVDPDLVVRDKEGKPYSVRYDAVNAMLLNEFLKEHKKVEEHQATIMELRSMIAQQQKRFESKLTKQEDQIKALTAGLQKVSAQLELGKSAPQTVLNNQ